MFKEVNELGIPFIKCEVVHFSLDVWASECAVRQAEGSGPCSSVVLCLLFLFATERENINVIQMSLSMLKMLL